MEPEYDFCYTEGKPETLVMLKDVKSISKLLFADPQLNTFVWIGDRDDQQMMNAKQRIQLQLGEFFYFYSSVQSAKKQLLQDRPQYTVLVISIQMFKEGKQLNSIHKVKSTFFYSKTNDDSYKYMRPYAHSHQNQQLDSEDEGYQKQQNEANQWLQNVYTDQKQLTEKLKEYKGTTSTNKILPNFVFMANQIKTSHALIRTLYPMLNQRIDQQTTKKINEKFKILVTSFEKLDEKKLGEKIFLEKDIFFEALNNGLKTDEQIINWYVEQTFAYKIINKLLRAHQKPTQVFFIQPFVKKLFETIHKLYLQQSKQIKQITNIWEFKVYRGGMISGQQFELFKNNKSQKIQNLGFFSTTLDLKIAKQFQKKGNCCFEVDVIESAIGSSEFGFVNLEKWGLQKFSQKQILFNPLNSFQILDARQTSQGQYQIKLRYHLLNDIQEQKDLSKFQKAVAQLQKQEKYQNECQGNALTNQYYHMVQGEHYWEVYLDIVKQSDDKFEKLFNELLNQNSEKEFESIQNTVQLLALSKLKLVYGSWNSIFYSTINEENLSYYNRMQQFWSNLLFLFGDKHQLYIKFKQSLQLSQNDKQYFEKDINRRGLIYKLSKIEEQIQSQPQFLYLISVISDIYLHHGKQKQIISKKVNLSNRRLDNQIMNTKKIREMFEGDIETLDIGENGLKVIPQYIYEKKTLKILKMIQESIGNLINLKSLNIQDNQVENLPQKIGNLTKLTQLNLRNNCIQILPQSFGKLAQLRFLNLEKNQLQSLPQKFGQLTSLKWLYLSNNKLQNLPEKFENLIHLTQLRLDNNKLKNLFEKVGKLIKLVDLNLQNNQLEMLPESIGNLTELLSLTLQGNKIGLLPDQIGNLKNLQWLYLSNNQLKTLPEAIGNLRKLSKLSLWNNQLQVLPQCIGGLTRLRFLDLGDNRLSKLPDRFETIMQLQWLCLKNNRLEAIPETIGNLSQLTQLSLQNNLLFSLPGSIAKITYLRSLKLDGNKLKILPEQIENLTQLTQLSLQNNKLFFLSESIGKLTNIKILNLENNKLSALPEPIGSIINLRLLNLGVNNLNNLPPTFSQLTQIQFLYLNNNKLQALPQKIENLIQLIQLNISHNCLSTFPSFSNLNKLQALNISFNPILQWPFQVFQKFATKLIIDTDQIPFLSSKSIIRVTLLIKEEQKPKQTNAIKVD